MHGWSINHIRQTLLTALEAICACALWIIVALLAGGGLERNLIGTSYVGNTDDISAILMATLFMLGLPVALSRGGHVRVDLLYRLYPPRLQAFAERLFKVFGIAAGMGLAAAGLALAYDSFSRERMYYGIIDLPLWIPQLVIAMGALAFTLEFIIGVEEPEQDQID